MSVTILPGPLTAFDPPSSCFSQVWGTFYPSQTAPAIVLGNPDDSACAPPRFGTNVIYSPALCPSRYYEASKGVVTQNAITETVLACCPVNFSHDGGTYRCVSTFPSTGAVTYTLSTSGRTITTSTPYRAGEGLNAHSIQVRYQSSDSAVLHATSTQSTSQKKTSSKTSSAVVPPTSSLSSPSSPPDAGLSTGAKAGIGVGVALGVIAVIAAIIWIVLRKRSKKKRDSLHSSPQQSPSPPDSSPRYEMGSSSAGISEQKRLHVEPVELDTSRR